MLLQDRPVELPPTDRAQGHIVTLEISSGEVYRGKLIEGASSVASLSTCQC
jgi:hypothetical protein